MPTVLTVHDLIFKLFPEYHKKLNYWYLNLAMPLYCRRADAIIAGCTEIPLVLSDDDTDAMLVSSTDELARRTIQLARGERALPDT